LAEPHVTLQHCQLVLSFDVTRGVSDDKLIDLAQQENFVAFILYDSEGDEGRLQRRATNLVKPIQAQGSAILIAGDSRIAVRLGADGMHSEEESHIALERFPKNVTLFSDKNHDENNKSARERKYSIMRGYGNIKDRHSAMELGEAGADYIMFGKLGADKQPQPHPRNLRLATWWANLMKIPCIIQAGTDIESIGKAVETGAEFIAIEEMIFSNLDEHAALVKLRQFLNNYKVIGQNDA